MKYKIWREGFLVTGMEGEPAKASFVGEYEANSFKEACIQALGHSSTFNVETLTDWGCKLHDNENTARKAFG